MSSNPTAVSTWSLHHTLGVTYDQSPGATPNAVARPTFGPGNLSLADLPRALATNGYHRVELCHFHLPSRAESDLQTIRRSFAEAGVIIQTLLIDDGDLTNPETRDRDLAWMKDWIDVAGHLGAEHARLVAGKRKPDAAALSMAVDGLAQATAHARSLWPHLTLVTENWFDLLSTPAAVEHVLDHVPGLNFLADTGNWSGTTKQADLTKIFARASLCHFKVGFDPGQHVHKADFRLCLQAARDANYRGPLTLIFDADGDEWQGLATLRNAITAFG
jgi:sugar phosphate isomerase/epimerase